eukprot:Gb_27250 [translate_table: standard]
MQGIPKETPRKRGYDYLSKFRADRQLRFLRATLPFSFGARHPKQCSQSLKGSHSLILMAPTLHLRHALLYHVVAKFKCDRFIHMIFAADLPCVFEC